MATKTWAATINSHLELATQVARHMPSNELLEVEDLNKVLHNIESLRKSFLFMCELHGFKILEKEDK